MKKEPPRLTSALRAFAHLSIPYERPTPEEYRARVAKKRRQKATKDSKKSVLNWEKLCSILKSDAKDVKNEDITALTRQLLKLVKGVVGEAVSEDILQSSACYFVELFMHKTNVTPNDTRMISGLFGSHSKNDLRNICDVVQRMVSWLDEDSLKKLSSPDMPAFDTSISFGSNIMVKTPTFVDYSQVELPIRREDPVNTLNLQYKPESEKTSNSVTKKDSMPSNWLKTELGQRCSFTEGLSINDLCLAIFDTLSSTDSDDSIQNNLFELLGFEQFDFIQELIRRRHEVVNSMLTAPLSMAPSSTVKYRDAEVKPNYGAQVTIQSESEKHLMKEMRKEEKRLNRKHEKSAGVDDSSGSGLTLDTDHLRSIREEQLLTAASRPVFSGSIRKGEYSVTYPHVYDSLAKAKQSSAFVGGTKLVLPEGFEKNSTKIYEEVHIPATDLAPHSVGQNRVKIDSLDEIAQVGFKGMKTLNRIQSVVFPTAYGTNENLLICAPTGAGKTNIAMLTILNIIKQHIENGVVRKDKFKIVYVAPMKALAAEMVRNFGKRLEPLNIAVRELTGDMSLTKQEILNTQMLVTTPEKWDVVTRKSTGDVSLVQLVKLLIIDEVHLLHEDRGSVIETLVARTLRQVESSQNMIRIVGLSATLPNYMDVAKFLHVNPFLGLFFFDGRFRPVPLGMTFVGVKTLNRVQRLADFNEICYDKVFEEVKKGEQVMVFVHARNETVRTAMNLRDLAKQNHGISYFLPETSSNHGEALKVMSKSRNKQLRELFSDGFAIHHAGMLRSDRNLVEKYFAEGHVKCLVCTATLAWGVNLPAHAVVIKGTDLYDAKKGTFIDLGVLDVLQIFGRAGRPQFDKYGHGTIITTHDKLSHYLTILTQQNPIESQFETGLTDNLNAEICLGTVTNLDEAVKWLSYTYMFVRMKCNPLVYGINYKELSEDPTLENHRRALSMLAAKALDKAKMIRFDERQGNMYPTDLGRTASHFYIKYDTVEVINECLTQMMEEPQVLLMMSRAQEFQQLKVRDDELEELDKCMLDTCPYPVKSGSENPEGKVNILLQTYISKQMVDNFSLVSDMSYVAQNAGRISRALFEITLRKNWSIMTGRLLTLSKVIEQQLWEFENPLRQFRELKPELLNKLERGYLVPERLREMSEDEIGVMIRHKAMGKTVKNLANSIPKLDIDVNIQPITRTDFKWVDKYHGNVAESFWIWVEDPETNHIYHHEYFTLHKKQAVRREPVSLVFTIPIFEPLPSQYIVKSTSDRWLGSDSVTAISFKHLILPEKHPPHTDLLDLQPLPVIALGDMTLSALYKFSHFNPIQTQIFHTLYHTDCNVLLGAPTGSGKTVAAEMAIFRLFRQYPGHKAVYIAPLKALVRERMDDWKVRIEKRLGKRVVEMTGDIVPDMKAVAAADLIVTTPEKWDGVSRSWQNRNYVQKVTLVIIDEIHLLGADRGPVLEVVVSRTNFISANTGSKVRVVGLSTALANARDLADWLGIKEMGLFNFRPSVRPVPLEVHITGFHGKHYCPRMATMNKPAFKDIKLHSPEKPVLIFVSSRRQTRLTALDLIALLAAEGDPKQWLHTPEEEIDFLISGIHDTNLKLTLAFGIGLHHAGLHERDRKTVEELFVNQKIQILIATSTLAWGVNFPAHLVIVKGTEYFDGKLKRYVDFPITG